MGRNVTNKPNVVFIYTDDLRYRDVIFSSYNGLMLMTVTRRRRKYLAEKMNIAKRNPQKVKEPAELLKAMKDAPIINTRSGITHDNLRSESSIH